MDLFNHEAEQQILGALFAIPNIFPKINRHVHADDFHLPLHGAIYSDYAQAIASGNDCNIVLITRKYSGHELSSMFEQDHDYRLYMAGLAGCLVTAGGAIESAKHVRSLSKKRRLAEIANTIMEQVEKDETDPAVLAAHVASDVTRLSDAGRTGMTAHALVGQTIAQTMNTAQCTPTGFIRMDAALAGGLYGGNMYAFAARMKAGKTAMLATIAYQIAMAGHAVRYLCLEMGGKQINDRLIARHGHVNALDYLDESRRMMPTIQSQLRHTQEAFADLKITYDDCAGITLDELLVMIADVGMSGKYSGVVIDYFQLVRKEDSRESDATFEARVAQRIAQIVKKFPNIWILTAAQLNREGEVRGSDGLRMACDVLFLLETAEIGANDGGTQIEAWLTMSASRYTPYRDIGSEQQPAYRLRKDIGPFYEEV